MNLHLEKPLPAIPSSLPNRPSTFSHAATYAIYNRRDSDGPSRRLEAVLLLAWAPTSSPTGGWWEVLEDVLAYAPITTAKYKTLRVEAVARILANAPNLDTLLNLAFSNQFFWTTFHTQVSGCVMYSLGDQEYNLDFIRDFVKRTSMPLWEFCEVRLGGRFDTVRGDYRLRNRYIQTYKDAIDVIERVRLHLFPEERATLTSKDLDNALARIWTFSLIFGAGSPCFHEAKRHECWLAGESWMSPKHQGPSGHVIQSSEQLRHAFGKGNEHGLQSIELRLMLRTWELLQKALHKCRTKRSYKLANGQEKQWAVTIMSRGLDAVDKYLREFLPLIPSSEYQYHPYEYGFQYACMRRLERRPIRQYHL
ncbi:hypothetical protein FE257_002832 [Aspergillus nanangensis]|uniref:Uncharacterized protein n=1 Tax=Aspergillus nanangensis TaxID=2582783 RepID=A0AAD4GNV1_ASPNN|nr:hypothetical protein FE257_002832 [Aspergillus nanangensis]